MDNSTKNKHMQNIETMYLHFISNEARMSAATIDLNFNNPSECLHMLLLRGPAQAKFAALLAAQRVMDEFKENPDLFKSAIDMDELSKQFKTDKEAFIQKLKEEYERTN